MNSPLHNAAKHMLGCQLSVIPAKQDKTPAIASWKAYQTVRMPEAEVSMHFNGSPRIAIICGSVSGNLEVVDVDLKYDLSGTLLADIAELISNADEDLWNSLTMQSTVSGGVHILYRCETIGRNAKLANRIDKVVLIETRGEGGYIIAAPSDGYQLFSGHSIEQIPVITPEQRELILSACRSFNQMAAHESKPPKESKPGSWAISPGDDFDARVDVIELLQHHGWKLVMERGEKAWLKRPGDSDAKHSATWNVIPGRFWCWSTSTQFESETVYKPYAVYAMLSHGGNYSDAAKALFAQGYGKSAELVVTDAIAVPLPIPAKPVTTVPLDVFPERLSLLITELDENNHFPVPYSLASLLFAASVAVGKSQAIYAAGYKNHPTLWLAMVGMPGMNKSSPLKWFLSPFSKRDKDAYKKYTDEMKQFESLPKSEREGAHKPQRKQHIVQDATLEALQYVLDGNTRGIGVYSDELDTWYSSFDRYNKSGDQSAWLSMWSGITVSKNRVSSRDVYIDNPFCSVIGGLQPSVLKNLGCKDRQNNGFIYRILFVSSDEDKRPPNRKYNPVEEDNRKAVWAACIKNILSVLPVSEDEPQKVTLSKEASDVLFNRISGYRATYNSLRVKCDENYMQLISKLEIYAYRFCLLLNAIHVGFGTDGATTETISGTVAEGAMRLLDYFEGSTLKALEAIISQDEVAALNELQMRIYNALPDRFPTSLALMVAEKSGGSAITMKRMLKNKELFEKIRHGEYGKTP